MQTHHERRRDTGVEYPSEDAKREATDFFERMQRTARSDFEDCWTLAKRFDDFRQRACSTTPTTPHIAADQPAIRDVLHAPITSGAQQVCVPWYTTDAPYPASNAEIQIIRHGQDNASPCAVHLVSTTMHFTQQQGEKWITELLRNWRPLKKHSFDLGDLEFLGFFDDHRQIDIPQLWQEWNLTHPERPYEFDNFRNHLKRLIGRLRPPGVLVDSGFNHLPVILTRQEDGKYTAILVHAGARASAATADAALIAVLHIERASSEEAGPEE